MKSKLLIAALLMGIFALSVEIAMARSELSSKENPSITEEQYEKIMELSQEYQKVITPLLEEVHAKQLQLNAISKQSNADQNLIRTLSQEIAILYSDLRQKELAFQERAYKETGIYLGNAHSRTYENWHGMKIPYGSCMLRMY